MLRIIGVGAISLSAILIGVEKTQSLHKRAKHLETTISMLIFLSEYIKSTKEIFKNVLLALINTQCFKDLDFIYYTYNALLEGKELTQSFKTGLDNSDTALTKEDKFPLIILAETLGSSNLTSQLIAIENTIELLKTRLSQAVEYENKIKGLYTTLGVAIGAGLFIIFI